MKRGARGRHLCGDRLVRVLLSAALGLFFCATSPVLGSERGKPSRFLVISDIHFNPFLHPDLFSALRGQPVSDWRSILESSPSGGVSQYGSDSNYPLLKSAFEAATKVCPEPGFILYIGDSLAHNWRSQYDKLASRSSHDDPVAYRSFTAKTVEFLALEFQRHFPGVPVLPTIGNEDAYCGDYQVEPGGPFLEMFARAWMPLPGPAVEPAEFQTNFSRGGYYSARLPSLAGHQVIVLNSIFFSSQYRNACGSEADTPGDDEMAWFAAVLDRAKRSGQKVWLIMHIPLGINDYNTVKDEQAGGEPVEFWLSGYSWQFTDLVRKFNETIQVAFSGHTHMDDFRVIEAGQTPLVVNKLVPSISPIFRNNPGFQVYSFDPASGAIGDYTTYYLANLSTEGKPTDLEHVRWEKEYDFAEAYKMPSLDISAIVSIARDLKTDPAVQALYTRFYSVGGPPAFDRVTLSAYSCAILHSTMAEFEKCQRSREGAAQRQGRSGGQ